MHQNKNAVLCINDNGFVKMSEYDSAELGITHTKQTRIAAKERKNALLSTTVFENKRKQVLTSARFWCKIYQNHNTFIVYEEELSK